MEMGTVGHGKTNVTVASRAILGAGVRTSNAGKVPEVACHCGVLD